MGRLPRQTRYYQGNIDLNIISAGEDYRKLKKSFVIFICTFGPFGDRRHIYTFENKCVENPSLTPGDEYYDCYICPNIEILKYRTTNREGYREYKSEPEKCKNCPYLKQCTESKDNIKAATGHIWESYMEQAEDIRHTIEMKEIYSQRKETIERVFANAREKHGMRYTQYRRLAKIKMELNLLFVYSLSEAGTDSLLLPSRSVLYHIQALLFHPISSAHDPVRSDHSHSRTA